MKYILTETEYQEILASKKRAHEFLTLKEAQKINASRLKLVAQLMRKKARHFRAEYVCIAQNPKTGITRVISAIVADTYRKFGWTVSEEFLIDRPA